MTLRGVLPLLRPVNLLGLLAATEAGARLSGAPPWSTAAWVPCTVAAFGYARNDAFDAGADRLNRPGRPVPSGRMSPRAAEAISWAILAGAVAFSVSIRLAAPHWIAFFAAVAGLYVYSPWGKEWGPVGPALIALLSALAVLWGGWLGAAPERAAAAALLAAAATFARECAKDIEDLEGDRAVGRRTWAVRSGPMRVERAARCAAALAFVALPVPWLRGDADLRYLALAGALGAPIFAWVALRPGRYDRAVARRASVLLKLALFAGIAGLLLGARG